MSSWKVLSALALLSSVASYACTGTWNGTTGTSNWTTTTWVLSGCSVGITYPGETTADTAIFPSGAASPATLDINAPITLNILTFDNNTSNPAYTISGPDTLTFAGATPFLNDQLGTQIISAPIALDLMTDTLTIAIVNSGDTLTLSGGVTDIGTSSITVASGLGTFINSSTLAVGANITLNSGSIVENTVSMAAGGTFTIAGAIVTSNNSSTPPFTCKTVTSGPVLSGATVNITSGTITLDSSACGTLATAGVVGTTIQSSTNALAISGGTVNVTNEAAITATGAGATGGLLRGVGVTVSGGAVNLTNTGTISGANDAGVFLYSNTLASGNPMTFSGGTVTATNNGSVTMGVGALVQSGSQGMFNNPINVSGGTLTLANTFNLTSTTAATGASLVVGPLTVSAGALNLDNTGNIASFPGQGTNGIISGNITVSGGSMTLLNGNAASPNTTGSLSGAGTLGGVKVTASGNFIQSGGTFTNENAGTIAVGTGTFTNIAGTTSLSTGGTFTNSNSGNVTNPAAIGSYFLNGGNIGLGAGITVNLSNSGTITAGYPGSVGSFIKAPTITDSGSILNITNSGSVSGYVGLLGFPGTIGAFLYSTESMSLTGGTWTATNTGAVPAGGTGLQIECDTNFTLGGNASITLINDTPANVSTITSIGCQFTVLNTLNFPIGSTSSLSLINNQNMSSSGQVGSQAIIQLGSSMAGGTLNITNTNTIGPSAAFSGAVYLIEAGAFIQTGGTVNMNNSGTVSSTTNFADGVGLKVSGSPGMSLTGGNFNMTNSGTIDSASVGVIGATTSNAGPLTIGGTAIVAVTNNGPVSSPTAAAIGCEFIGFGITMSGGTFTLINNGTISGVFSSVGAYLNNSSTGPMIFSGGTFTGTNNSSSIGSASGVKVISGPAGGASAPIVVDGGTVILTNAGTLHNTSSGPGSYIQGSSLAVSAGSLNLSNSGNLSAFTGSATEAVFSSIAITGGATTLLNAGSLSSGGTGVQVTASTGATMSGGSFNVTNTANLSGTSKGAVFLADISFNQTGGTFTVSNSGTNSGSGNASYILSPAINISGTGTFNNPNGLVAAATVKLTSGGILQSGTATVPGVFQDASFGSTTTITNNGGTFVSGTLNATPGQTTINGTFTQTSGTYTIVIGNLNLPSNQGISFLTVNGTGVVNLDGGTLNVIPATGFNIATDIPAGLGMVQFIQASTKINGGFSPLKINNSVPGLTGMSYETLASNTQGWLLFSIAPPTPPPPAPIMPTSTPIPYQPIIIATVNFINTFIGRELIRMQEQLITNDQAYDDTEYKSSFRRRKESANTAAGPPLSMVKLPIRAHTIADTAITDADPEIGFMNYQLQKKQQQLASEIQNDNPWNIYCGPLADLGKINNKHSQLGANFHSLGGLAGVDYRFSQAGVGILIDYEHVKAKLHKHGGDFSINQFHATAYSTYVPESFSQFALNGMVGSGEAWYNIHRHISELKESTHAKSRGVEVDALIGAQYLFSHCQFASIPYDLEIIPMVNLQYIYQKIGSYKEHGAGINDFKFHKYGFQSLRSTLGTWLQYRRNWNNFSVTALVDISWQREFLDQNQNVNLTPINTSTPSDALTIFGAARNTLLAGLDLLFEFYNTYGVEAGYDFEYNSLYHNSAFYVGLNVRF